MYSPPFFSVIIPAYNRANILDETLDYVLKQTFGDWECIVVDDGSTDDTRVIVEARIKDDPRISYVYQTNAERSVARNHGAKIAKGKYLLFLDSDDGYTPDHLTQLYNFIQQNETPIALIITDHWEMHNSGELLMPDSSLNNLDTLPYLWSVPVVPVRACIHRKIFQTHQFDPHISVVEDQVLWFHIASSFPVIRVRQRTAVYRIHEGNSVSKKNNPFKKRLDGLNRMFKSAEYKNAKLLIPKSQRNKMIAQCYFRIGELNLQRGERWKGFIDFVKCQLKAPGFKWKACIYLLLKSYVS